MIPCPRAFPAAGYGLLALGATSPAIASPTVAQAGDQVAGPPALTLERHPEDWSYLAGPSRRTGRWTEPWKYVPLSDTGSIYLSTGVEARSRLERTDNINWSPDADNDHAWLRLTPHVDVQAGRVRMFVQPILSDVVGADRPATGVDTTGADILQAFVQTETQVTKDATLTLTAGRRLVTLGAGRLIDTRYGPNVPEAFEGADATVEVAGRSITVLGLRPVDTRVEDFDDRASDRKAVWGLYATQWSTPDRRAGFDVFWLGYRDRAALADQGEGREEVHSFGVRVFGAAQGWRWNMEGVLQRGRFEQARTSAWGIGSEFGRRFETLPMRPELALTADYSSGDEDPDDGRFGTFNPMFPRGSYFVSQSPIGPRNLIHLQPSLTVHPWTDVSVTASGAAYWRASTGDGVYAMPGHLIRSGWGSDARYIGSHIELAMAWRLTPELDLSASIGVFEAGDFIRETGPSTSIGLANLTTTFRF